MLNADIAHGFMFVVKKPSNSIVFLILLRIIDKRNASGVFFISRGDQYTLVWKVLSSWDHLNLFPSCDI